MTASWKLLSSYLRCRFWRVLRLYSVKRSGGVESRKLSDFLSLKIEAGDAIVFIYNICSISQAGRRGFDPAGNRQRAAIFDWTSRCGVRLTFRDRSNWARFNSDRGPKLRLVCR